jgi:hypothetical protein
MISKDIDRALDRLTNSIIGDCLMVGEIHVKLCEEHGVEEGDRRVLEASLEKFLPIVYNRLGMPLAPRLKMAAEKLVPRIEKLLPEDTVERIRNEFYEGYNEKEI